METPNEEVSNQEVSEEAQEAEINAAAKAEIEASAPKEEATPTDTKTTVTAPDKAAKREVVSPNTAKTGQADLNYEKSYKELQRKFTQTAQEAAAVKRQMEAMQKLWESKFAEATKKPVNLEEFFTNLRAQGPDAILPYLKPELEKLQSAYADQFSNVQRENGALRMELSLLNRRLDSKNYPDFTALEPKMRELVDSGTAPIDFTKPMDEVIDALYNLVRTKNSEEAIKLAEKAGHAKAEAELAKEAKTAVAGGGKGTSTTPADMWKMPLDKLEQLVGQMHGVADRD